MRILLSLLLLVHIAILASAERKFYPAACRATDKSDFEGGYNDIVVVGWQHHISTPRGSMYRWECSDGVHEYIACLGGWSTPPDLGDDYLADDGDPLGVPHSGNSGDMSTRQLLNEIERQAAMYTNHRVSTLYAGRTCDHATAQEISVEAKKLRLGYIIQQIWPERDDTLGQVVRNSNKKGGLTELGKKLVEKADEGRGDCVLELVSLQKEICRPRGKCRCLTPGQYGLSCWNGRQYEGVNIRYWDISCDAPSGKVCRMGPCDNANLHHQERRLKPALDARIDVCQGWLKCSTHTGEQCSEKVEKYGDELGGGYSGIKKTACHTQCALCDACLYIGSCMYNPEEYNLEEISDRLESQDCASSRGGSFGCAPPWSEYKRVTNF